MIGDNDKMFEAFSAWLDGEEPAPVKVHDQDLRDLRRLGQRLRQPALPDNFAASTARAILADELPPAPGLKSAARPGWFGGLRPASQTIAPLLRRQMELGASPANWMKLVTVLFGAPGLWIAMARPQQMLLYLSVALVLGAGTITFYYLNRGSSAFGSLLRGKAFDEFLSTGLDPAEVVDGFAWHQARAALVASLPLALVTLPLVLTFFAPSWPAVALLPLLLGGLSLAASYVDAFAKLRLRHPGVSYSRLLPALLPMAMFYHHSPLAAGGLGLTWIAYQTRRWALDSLGSSALENNRSGSPNSWLTQGDDNPVVARELKRRASRLGGGLGRWVASWLVGWTPLVATAAAVGLTPWDWKGFAWVVCGLWLFSYARAASLTSDTLTREQREGSLETLLQCPLTPQDYGDGWRRLALVTHWSERLATAALLCLGLYFVPERLGLESPLYGMAAGLVVALGLRLFSVLGADHGLRASALAANTRQAAMACLGTALRGGLTWLLLSGIAVTFIPYLCMPPMMFKDDIWTLFVQRQLPALSLLLLACWGAFRARKEAELAVRVRWGLAEAPAQPTWKQELLLLPATTTALVLGTATGTMALCLIGMSLIFGLGLKQLAGASLAAGCFSLCLVATRMRPASLRLLAVYPELPKRRLLLVLSSALAGLAVALLPRVLQLLFWVRDLRNLLGELPFSALTLIGLPLLGAMAGWALAKAAPRLMADSAAGRKPYPLERITRPAAAAVVCLLAGWALIPSAFPSKLDPEVFELQRDAQAHRLRVSQIDPDENGFLVMGPAFSSHDSIAVQQPFRLLGQLRDLPQAERARLLPDYLAQFETVLPTIERAASYPHYSYAAENGFGYSSKTPNFTLMRATTFSLQVRSEHLESQGFRQQAAENYLLGLRWVSRPSGDGYLITEMLAVGMMDYMFDGLEKLLARPDDGSLDYRSILTELQQIQVAPANLGVVLDEECLSLNEALDQWVTEGQTTSLGGDIPLKWLPNFFLEHERAVCLNAYAGRRHRYRTLDLAGPNDNMAEELSKHSLVANMLMVNVDRVQAQFQHNLTRLEGARTMAALRAYHRDHQRYPENLGELVPAYMADTPVDYMSKDHGSLDYQSDQRSFELRSVSSIWVLLGRRGKDFNDPENKMSVFAKGYRN